MTNYQEYPKEMHHPQEQRATHKVESSEGLPKGLEPGTYDARPARLPPVTVHSREQEEQAAAKGYVPNGESDPEAYRRGVLKVVEPDQHVHREYPKWKYHPIEEPVIVNTAAEEEALGTGWADNPAGPFEEMGAAATEAETTLEAPTRRTRAKRSTSSRTAA